MKFLKLCLLSLVLMSSSAFARSEGHIVSASSRSSLNFTKGAYSDSYKADFSVVLGYDYALSNGLQFGGSFGSSIASGSSVFALGFGPGYNFSKNNIENSVFVDAKVGVVSAHYDGDGTDTNAFVSAEVGKRFKVLDNVSYVPGFYIEKILGTNTPAASFSFEILRLSLVF